MSAAISCRNLSVRYGRREVLRAIDLDLPAGELLGIIGPNGSGKTTLLRAVLGVAPSSGTVAIDGVPLERMSPRDVALRVAVVPQAPQLPDSFSVADVVAMGRNPHLGFLAGEGAADRRAIWTALEQADTLELARRPVGELSGGERQRVVIARALAQEAPILFLDEPTTHLDIGHQAEMLHLVARLRRERNLTVVVVLHDLSIAARFCPRLILLDQGRIVADGAPETVIREEILDRVYGPGVRLLRLEDGETVVVPDIDAVAENGDPRPPLSAADSR